jgi:hypothetical protein
MFPQSCGIAIAGGAIALPQRHAWGQQENAEIVGISREISFYFS